MPVYDVTFGDPTLQEMAEEMCNGNQLCLYDIASTGRFEIGQTTVQDASQIDNAIELSVLGKLVMLICH